MPQAALLRPEPVEPARSEVALHVVPAAAPVAPRLEIPAYDLDAALTLRRELGISHVLAQVLVRRGIADPVSARAFLDPREVHEPSAFAGS